MEISGSHFIYNGVASKSHSLVFANVDTSRFINLSGDVASVTIFSKQDGRNHFIDENLSDSPIVFEAEVVTDDDHALSVHSRREIEKWLFHQPNYRKLYIDEDCDSFAETYEAVNGEYKQLYLNCRFVNPSKIESAAGVVGYKFSVECDSRFAWQDPTTFAFELTSNGESSNTVIDVVTDTDSRDYIYPKVTITMGEVGGDIIISNLTDDATRTTSFSGLTQNITFVMNGNGVNYVSGDNYSKFSNRNFIRLLDGENRLSLYGDIVGIKFEFQNQRYL